MNGFREELLSRIIGLNGHATFYVNNNSESINADNIEKILLGFDEVFDVVSLVEKVAENLEQSQFLDVLKNITSKGFVRNQYKEKLIDLTNVRLNIKSKNAV